MSLVVSKSACPRCRQRGQDQSGDNLATYSDGHQWCFACHYLVRPQTTADMAKRVALLTYPPNEEGGGIMMHMPDDLDTNFPQPVLIWLKTFDLTPSDFKQLDLCWSAERKQLIFPFFNAEGEVLAFQARNFRENGPKWLTFGPMHDIMTFYKPVLPPKEDHEVVLTEDVISAYKVGKVVRASPIFGSNPGTGMLSRYGRRYSTITFWFDRDAVGRAISASRHISQFFPQVKTRVIVSDFDPKAYSVDEIKKFLKIGEEECSPTTTKT